MEFFRTLLRACPAFRERERSDLLGNCVCHGRDTRRRGAVEPSATAVGPTPGRGFCGGLGRRAARPLSDAAVGHRHKNGGITDEKSVMSARATGATA
jgi:hypothetical protein